MLIGNNEIELHDHSISLNKILVEFIPDDIDIESVEYATYFTDFVCKFIEKYNLKLSNKLSEDDALYSLIII